MIRRAAALACVLLLGAGCRETPPEAPAEPAAEAPAPAAPEAPSGPSVDERRAKFEARPTIALPDDLPPAWARFMRAIEARPTAARHEVRSTAGREPWRAVQLTARVFGEDEAVQAKVHAALAALDLPALPAADAVPEGFWRGEPVIDGDVRWNVDIGRLVAPPGEPREQIVELRWQRAPDDPDDPRNCRKPPEVPPPAGAPPWLVRVTDARTTRRRITAASDVTPTGREVAIRMLFRNGFAHDEHVRHLAEGAEKAGFVRARGEGPRQAWRHPDGAVFEFAPDTTDDLGLGCALAGPVIAMSLRTPARPGASQ